MAPLPLILRSLAANSSIALGFKIISIPLGYFTLIVIARLFGAEQMGTYSIGVYLVATLSVFCRLGLDTGLLRFFAALKAEGKGGGLMRLFWPSLGLVLAMSTLAAIAMYGFKDWLAWRFNAPALSSMLGLVAPALPLSVVAALCGEAVRALGGVRWVVFSQDFLSPLIIVSLVIALAYGGSQLLAPSQALGLAFFLATLGALMFLCVTLGSYVRREENKVGECSLRPLLHYSWPLFLSSLLMLAFGSLDSLILGFFSSPEKVAYYESAAKSALIISLPLIAVNAAIPPLLAQFHQLGDLKRLEAVVQASSRWMYFLALPLTILGVVLAGELLSFFGAGFSKAETALRLLALAQLVNVACGSVGLILAMTGHQVTLTLVLAMAGAVGLPLMGVAAAWYGLIGLAAAKGLWIVAVNLLMSLAVWRHLKIRVFAVNIGWAHLGGLLGVGLFCLTKPHLGWIGATGFFVLGYVMLTIKILCHEISALIRHPQWEGIK